MNGPRCGQRCSGRARPRARSPRLPLLAAGAALSGCASVPPEAGFPEVARDVAERTGGLRVHWNQGTPEDEAVAWAVRETLGRELSADDAVQVALLSNRELQAVYEDLLIAQADLVSAGLLSNPVFSLDYRLLVHGGTSIEGSVTQNFLELFFLPLRKRIAGAGFGAAKARVTGAVVAHAARTRAAYHSLQAAQQLLEMRAQVARATAASHELARRLREAGNITALDLSRERALHEQSLLDLAAAEADVLRGRERLSALMGVWGEDTGWRIAGRLADPTDDIPSAEEAERRAVAASIELVAAEAEVRAAELRLGVARPAGLFPAGDAGVSFAREGDGEWGIGPAVSVPIPVFSQGQPAVARARAELRRAGQRHAALAVEVRSRVRAAHAGATAARSITERYREELLPLRQRIVDESQAQFNAMRLGPFELLSARQEQIRSGEEYVGALLGYWLARTELEQLLAGSLVGLEGADGPGLGSDSAAGPRQRSGGRAAGEEDD